jgi:hypothetical protein
MQSRFRVSMAGLAALLICSSAASAQVATNQPLGDAAAQQSNVPAAAQKAEGSVERTVRRFRMGIEGGVGLDPELIMFGAHGTFAPIFHPSVSLRPGIEFGVGEVTTYMGINVDVLYTLPGSTRPGGWTPYIGAGPNFGLSHRGFEVDATDTDDVRNRFDFGDTDFEGGMNFIAGARRNNGMFLEMKATAYGVSNVRLLAGYTF